MRIFRIPRWALVLFASLIACGAIFLASPATSAPAAPCAPVVCLPAAPAITVTLPRVTTTRLVTLPRQTVVVRKIVAGPGVTKTIVKPGPISTVTVTQTAPTGQNGHTSAIVSTATVTTTVTASPEVRTVNREHLIKVNVPQAVGLSLGFVVLGAIISALLLWFAYMRGYLNSEDRNVEDLKSLQDSLK